MASSTLVEPLVVFSLGARHSPFLQTRSRSRCFEAQLAFSGSEGPTLWGARSRPRVSARSFWIFQITSCAIWLCRKGRGWNIRLKVSSKSEDTMSATSVICGWSKVALRTSSTEALETLAVIFQSECCRKASSNLIAIEPSKESLGTSSGDLFSSVLLHSSCASGSVSTVSSNNS